MLTRPDAVTTDSICPECQAKLVTESDEAPWCERCQWNLDAFTPDHGGWLARRLARLDHHAGYDLSARLYRALVGQAVERPGMGQATVWLAAISGALLAAILGLAALGLWLIIDQPFLMKALGFLLLFLAFALRPRLGRWKSIRIDDDEITRSEAPHLFRLIDRVAACVDARVPHRVVLAPEWNAAAGTYGIRRRRVLMLGLPFWSVLRPQERVALLGHELGHFANGDPRAATLTAPALQTFGLLAQIVYPTPRDSLDDDFDDPWIRFGRMVTGPIFTLIAHVCHFTHLGINMIGARQSQRAEYYADELAVRVAGSQGSLGLLDMLTISDGLTTVVGGRSRANQLAAGWQEGVERARDGLGARLSRLRQLSLRSGASMFASHPAPGLRHALIASRPFRDGQVVLSETEAREIDAELARYEEPYRRVIAESW